MTTFINVLSPSISEDEEEMKTLSAALQKGADPSPQRTRSTAIKRIKRKELPHFFLLSLAEGFFHASFLPLYFEKKGGGTKKKKEKKGKGGRKKCPEKRERERGQGGGAVLVSCLPK
ncbi:hypothetical protein CEXT_67971 [Caerostris extrusa]|uniref:Uncharacterized protein n=1 Tax=Caerostris extrusa TaxID=172846 RepID=A0AAV4VUR5_CAEEX|nr:hypothetical protein CEXT_67971 [Caerostris extrusa]